MVTTSEVTVSLTANDGQSARGRAADDLQTIGSVRIDEGRSILVIVGQHLPERPGMGARILQGVAEAGVNVEMISHAFGAINLSLVVRDADVSRTVAVLHRVLFEEARA